MARACGAAAPHPGSGERARSAGHRGLRPVPRSAGRRLRGRCPRSDQCLQLSDEQGAHRRRGRDGRHRRSGSRCPGGRAARQRLAPQGERRGPGVPRAVRRELPPHRGRRRHPAGPARQARHGTAAVAGGVRHHRQSRGRLRRSARAPARRQRPGRGRLRGPDLRHGGAGNRCEGGAGGGGRAAVDALWRSTDLPARQVPAPAAVACRLRPLGSEGLPRERQLRRGHLPDCRGAAPAGRGIHPVPGLERAGRARRFGSDHQGHDGPPIDPRCVQVQREWGDTAQPAPCGAGWHAGADHVSRVAVSNAQYRPDRAAWSAFPPCLYRPAHLLARPRQPDDGRAAAQPRRAAGGAHRGRRSVRAADRVPALGATAE